MKIVVLALLASLAAGCAGFSTEISKDENFWMREQIVIPFVSWTKGIYYCVPHRDEKSKSSPVCYEAQSMDLINKSQSGPPIGTAYRCIPRSDGRNLCGWFNASSLPNLPTEIETPKAKGE